jgi:hypothetical protein
LFRDEVARDVKGSRQAEVCWITLLEADVAQSDPEATGSLKHTLGCRRAPEAARFRRYDARCASAPPCLLGPRKYPKHPFHFPREDWQMDMLFLLLIIVMVVAGYFVMRLEKP